MELITVKSWVLQSVMDMQKTLGQLTQAVNTLTDRTEKTGDKLEAKIEKLGDTLNKLSHKIYAAMVVVTIFGAIVAFLVDKGWSKIISILLK